MVKPDSYHLRVWRNVIWKDTYHARNSCATRYHSSSSRGEQAGAGLFLMLTYIKALFDHKQQMHEYDVTLSTSYMEIYRDEVYDLLVDRQTVSHALSVYSRQCAV
jgi:hypothetical protein